MSFSATALNNVEPHRFTSKYEQFLLPGDPGVTFTRGQMCSLSGGVLIAGTDSAANAYFRVEKTVVCPAATQEFVMPSDVKDSRDEDKDKTLVLVTCMVGDGVPVYLANIKNWCDETVVSYTASTRAIAETTGHTADDYPNGALCYVYEGPGIGEVNVVEDYDHTGGAAELLLICHRKFKATLTTSSKLIILAEDDTGANAVSLFGRVDLADDDEIDCADGASDGDYVVYCDWRQVAHWLALGQLPIINRMALYS